jgi:hypothetical protein
MTSTQALRPTKPLIYQVPLNIPLGLSSTYMKFSQGESVFRLRNVNNVDFYYLFNCAKRFGHTTIFRHIYFP